MSITHNSLFPRIRGVGRTCRRILFFIITVPAALLAQYQMSPPEFGDTYSFPSPAHPEPASAYLRFLDVGLLALALGIAIKLVYNNRSRKHLMLLSIGSVAYFGFYRKGCICSVGAIQNVVLSLVDPQYFISFSAIAIFFLPLLAALFFGRVFCSGVCPLGALQDLVVFRPLRVPAKLDGALRWLQYVYLAVAVLLAGWGLNLAIGPWHINLEQRFLICDWDPFIPIFRRTGPFYMVAAGAVFVVAGMFIGRPYCRWLCPYGGILAILSRVSRKNVRITPDKELNCGLCAEACPYGAIHELRADRANCMACARCYEYCPRQKRLEVLRSVKGKKTAKKPRSPRPWEAVARTWTGIAAGLLAVAAGLWLLATYVHVRQVVQKETSVIEDLREKSKMDAEIQKILQPELERQQEAVVRRRFIYDMGGAILLISGGLFVIWFHWLRPEHGRGAGVPMRVLKFLERPPARKSMRPRNPSNDSTTIS